MEISPLFRAGWEAFAETAKAGGSVVGAKMDLPATLEAAWAAHTGVATEPLPAFHRDEFVNDWNAAIATVSMYAEKYNMRKPDMVFHPDWLRKIRVMSHEHIAGTLVHMGVRVKFATWQQVDALKEI